MKRIFIPLARVEIGDSMHEIKPDGTFEVDEKRDGQTTEQHIEGIKFVKKVIENGQKIRPVLVVENDDGTYKRLDGFKRCMAQKELGFKNIEAFVCSPKEYEGAEEFVYDGYKMRCWHGGQEKEHYSLTEGSEEGEFNYDKLPFLFKSENPEGLRIEISDCIHVHWNRFGQYRLALGGKDFVELAKAIISING